MPPNSRLLSMSVSNRTEESQYIFFDLHENPKDIEEPKALKEKESSRRVVRNIERMTLYPCTSPKVVTRLNNPRVQGDK